MALFQGSDRISEYYDSHDMLYGGTGIITKDGILKPAGFAFDFLNRLLPYYIGKGENCILTTDGHGSYGILCHNAKKLNYNYYLSAENELDKENIWKYFEDREAKELAIRLRDVRDGVYQMKTYSINEKNGSVLDIWAEMEYESELTRNDIKYFRRTCEPRLKIQKVEAKEQTLDLDVTLAANEIAFIRLKWFA
jgi:beta-xylosidase